MFIEVKMQCEKKYFFTLQTLVTKNKSYAQVTQQKLFQIYAKQFILHAKVEHYMLHVAWDVYANACRVNSPTTRNTIWCVPWSHQICANHLIWILWQLPKESQLVKLLLSALQLARLVSQPLVKLLQSAQLVKLLSVQHAKPLQSAAPLRNNFLRLKKSDFGRIFCLCKF